VARILKCGREVKLESGLDAAAHPILDVEGVMIETDILFNDHIMKGLLA